MAVSQPLIPDIWRAALLMTAVGLGIVVGDAGVV
jgi:hypothetical protein